jgi:threonylcarbamoyladenosine tRNA methylthiotransferase MtaB
MGREFSRRGFQIVDEHQPADVVVLNTCSVTERADRECRQVIRRLRRRSPGAYVVVAGCYAELQPEAIAAVEGVDLILGSKEKFDLFSYAGSFEKLGTPPQIHVRGIHSQTDADPARSGGLEDRTRAFLKIQDGCDYSCTFCTIPLARGDSRSVKPDVVLAEARALVNEGFREIVLTGVNVGDYGKKLETSLLQLLAGLVAVDGLDRIRISSVEPNLLTDSLLDFWLSERKLCRHFHLPLQSGSDSVLARMRRRYRRSLYADRLDAVKRLAPEAAVGADVIVGFPGETDAEFDETYAFLADQPVSYLHVFTYSERFRTPAAELADQVEPRVRAGRSERLRALGVRKRREFHESYLGRAVDVLFEGEKEKGKATGLTDTYVRVEVESPVVLTNSIKGVMIFSAGYEGCKGRLLPHNHAAASGGKRVIR